MGKMHSITRRIATVCLAVLMLLMSMPTLQANATNGVDNTSAEAGTSTEEGPSGNGTGGSRSAHTIKPIVIYVTVEGNQVTKATWAEVRLPASWYCANAPLTNAGNAIVAQNIAGLLRNLRTSGILQVDLKSGFGISDVNKYGASLQIPGSFINPSNNYWNGLAYYSGTTRAGYVDYATWMTNYEVTTSSINNFLVGNTDLCANYVGATVQDLLNGSKYVGVILAGVRCCGDTSGTSDVLGVGLLSEAGGGSREIVPFGEGDEAQLIFKNGTRCVYRYVPQGITTTGINTYDTDDNPTTPDYCQDPTSDRTRQGTLIINKVYVDLTTGATPSVYRTTSCSRTVTVTDEASRLGNGWTFVTWQASTSEFQNKDSFNQTNSAGIYEIDSSYTVCNVLHVKGGAVTGDLIMSEQALNVTGSGPLALFQINGGSNGEYTGSNSHTYQSTTSHTHTTNYSGSHDSCSNNSPHSHSYTDHHYDGHTISGGTLTRNIDLGKNSSNGARQVIFHSVSLTAANASNLNEDTFTATTASSQTLSYTRTTSNITHSGNCGSTTCSQTPTDARGFTITAGTSAVFSITNYEIGRNDIAENSSSRDTVCIHSGFNASNYNTTNVNYLGSTSSTSRTIGTAGSGESAVLDLTLELPYTTITGQSSGSTSTLGVVTNSSGASIQPNIVVQAYRTMSGLPSGEAGDKSVGTATFYPSVIMRAYTSFTDSGSEAARVVCLGEYQRTLNLCSFIDWSWDGLSYNSGLDIVGTNLNDATAISHLDNVGAVWHNVDIFPGGSTLQLIKSRDSVGSGNRGSGTLVFNVDFGLPITDGTPFEYQMNNNWGELFNSTIMTNHSVDSGYVSISCLWNDNRRSVEQLNTLLNGTGGYLDFIKSACDAFNTMYICQFVHDDLTMETSEFIQIGKGTTTVNLSTSRTLSTESKYYFGGINNYSDAYFRAYTTGVPKIMCISMVGADTAGNVYLFPGDTVSLYRLNGSDTNSADDLFGNSSFNTNWASLGEHSKSQDDSIGDASIAWSATGYATAMSMLGFLNVDNANIRLYSSEAYIAQQPLHETGHFPRLFYLEGNNFVQHGSLDFIASEELGTAQTLGWKNILQNIQGAIDNNSGNDSTWFSGGRWYNEGVAPFCWVTGRYEIYIVFPSNSVTVLDPKLIGESDYMDDRFTDWNASYFRIVSDGNGVTFNHPNNTDEWKLTLGQYGTRTVVVDLNDLGRSDVFAIPNITVSDIH